MTLSLTKLFEVKEWKCHYFWDSVIFWCWKSSLKKLNFRALAIDGFWTKKHETKFFWSFLMISNPCFIRFEIKNHWLPLPHSGTILHEYSHLLAKYRHFAVSFIETLRIRISINYYAIFYKQIGREKNSEGPIWLLDYLNFFSI